MATLSALDRCRHFGVANIRGIAYMPGPSDYTKTNGAQYFDSDFYNGDFKLLWGKSDSGSNGRDDLARFKEQLGVNFIHCYDWSAPAPVPDLHITLRDHLVFLRRCDELGMKATIPISNYTYKCMADVGGKESFETPELARTNIRKVFKEIYGGGQSPAPGAGMWKIFNEYELWHDRNPEHVATAIDWLVQEEDKIGLPDGARLPIMVDCSFGTTDGIAGAGYVKPVWDALTAKGKIGGYSALDFWKSRFVFSTNPQTDGPFIANYLSSSLPKYWQNHGIPIPPVMFTELGASLQQTHTDEVQADWMTRELDASKPGTSDGNMLGACVFLNEQRPWEDNWEPTFGIMKFGPSQDWPLPQAGTYTAPTQYPKFNEQGYPYPVKGQYLVEQQAARPNYASVAKAWKGQ